jgi:hypothetical protein
VSADFPQPAAARLCRRQPPAPAAFGHRIFSGADRGDRRRRHEIHLETYIYADDRTGRRVAAALAAAARRGVAVRVLVDGFGARDFESGLGRDRWPRPASKC